MNTRVKHIENWVEVAIQAKWRVNRIAQLCGISTRALELHFREAKMGTPKQWVTDQRMGLAKEYLREGFLVKEAAAKLGYTSADHFSREFKRYWAVCPSQTASLQSKLRILTGNFAFRRYKNLV